MSRVAYLDLDGTLLGPGGSLLQGVDGVSEAGARALARLTAEGVPYVFVSGRSRVRVEDAARMLGADGALAELGALDAGYPVRDGETVHAAIAATGLPAELLAREPGLEVHPVSDLGREGSHVLRGRIGADVPAWVARRSGGALRLADNGRIGPGEVRIYHLVPTRASKALSVELDVARRGVRATACLAVGDSAEDVEIGQVVGTMALVANGAAAEPRLAALASFTTTGAHGAGVLEAVERWLAAAAGQ
jgi:hydroxymethylpyrimidine pyrophosphatase-like HAD family hydrolase